MLAVGEELDKEFGERAAGGGETTDEPGKGSDLRGMEEEIFYQPEGARALPLQIEPFSKWHGERRARGIADRSYREQRHSGRTTSGGDRFTFHVHGVRARFPMERGFVCDRFDRRCAAEDRAQDHVRPYLGSRPDERFGGRKVFGDHEIGGGQARVEAAGKARADHEPRLLESEHAADVSRRGFRTDPDVFDANRLAPFSFHGEAKVAAFLR